MEKIITGNTELKGNIDVVGLDVIYIHDKVENFTEADVKQFIEDNTKEVFSILDIEGEQYAIKATIANINKYVTILPEDLEQSTAMKVQFKIADVLQTGGINVNMGTEDVEKNLEKAAEEARAELDDENRSKEESTEEA